MSNLQNQSSLKLQCPSVMIVSNSKDLRDVFHDLLQIIEINVLCVGDIDEACRLHRIHKADVILLDVILPEYDGMYVVQYLKEQFPDIKIIMAASDCGSKERRDLKILNIPIIYKPFSRHTLKTTICGSIK